MCRRHLHLSVRTVHLRTGDLPYVGGTRVLRRSGVAEEIPDFSLPETPHPATSQSERVPFRWCAHLEIGSRLKPKQSARNTRWEPKRFRRGTRGFRAGAGVDNFLPEGARQQDRTLRKRTVNAAARFGVGRSREPEKVPEERRRGNSRRVYGELLPF